MTNRPSHPCRHSRRPRLLVIGAGDIARRAMPALARRYRVWALVRTEEAARQWRTLGAAVIVGDLDQPATLWRLAGIAASHLLYTAPPAPQGHVDARVRHVVNMLKKRSSLPQSLTYISSSGVYGHCHGQSIDETRRPAPGSARARRRLDAEQVWRRLAQRSGLRLTLLRAPGIHAAERLPLARILAGIPALLPGEDSLHTHVHADDLARACVLSLARRRGGTRCYNLGDHDALPGGDRLDLVADAFGLPRVPRLPAADLQAVVGPLRWSFLRESRQLDCRRIHQELDWTPQVSGVAALLATLSPAARARLLAAARTDG
ncbi:NAD-dependent epimerase/dehydratase family protein [Laribacter hongkongensis]|uniref:NAD-dependent epimerase/dehydratase family protein n=1 Tax=Laribacter hongkongensis TaxID=168471 RepID=UPI00358DBE10